MRLHTVTIRNSGPVKLISAENLADVVVLAGPNGVGKTSIINAIVEHLRNPNPSQHVQLTIQTTRADERTRWTKDAITTANSDDASKLRSTLQRNQRRNSYQSSVLHFDSDRAIRNIQSYTFSWDIGNPLMEDVGWDLGFSKLYDRYNDVRHSLFRLVESQRREAADKVFDLQKKGVTQMALDFPDVLKPFKDAFWQLLAPKKLMEVDIKAQQIYYEHEAQKLPLETLSSGEREVVNIVFDFLLRAPKDCIIVFDEPELHLHPELSYKLLQTLSRAGERNQFIFCTHSPEIISASLENTVIFISPPRTATDNQAVVVHQDDETHHALQTLGQSIGVISLGKKLILIEGQESSLDKQTYGAILKNQFPEFVMVPVGGKGTLRSFEEIRSSVLNKTIWGVEFFLLCDRDAVNAFGKAAVESSLSSRVRMLDRYHLENYFLDADTLAAAFSSLDPAGSCWRDPAQVNDKLREIARKFVPYAVSLTISATIREAVGNISIMPKGVSTVQTADELTALIVARVSDERTRVSSGLGEPGIRTLVTSEFTRLVAAIDNDDAVWRADLPGRVIFNSFASAAKIQSGTRSGSG
jgi:ABC-type cobalamin/Fe3+-siderophores transport system ATPase subunit